MNDVSFETAEFISKYASASHKFFELLGLITSLSSLPVFVLIRNLSITISKPWPENRNDLI